MGIWSNSLVHQNSKNKYPISAHTDVSCTILMLVPQPPRYWDQTPWDTWGKPCRRDPSRASTTSLLGSDTVRHVRQAVQTGSGPAPVDCRVDEFNLVYASITSTVSYLYSLFHSLLPIRVEFLGVKLWYTKHSNGLPELNICPSVRTNVHHSINQYILWYTCISSNIPEILCMHVHDEFRENKTAVNLFLCSSSRSGENLAFRPDQKLFILWAWRKISLFWLLFNRRPGYIQHSGVTMSSSKS